MELPELEDEVANGPVLVRLPVVLEQPVLDLGRADVLVIPEPLENGVLPDLQPARVQASALRLVLLDAHVPVLVDRPPVQGQVSCRGLLAEALPLLLLNSRIHLEILHSVPPPLVRMVPILPPSRSRTPATLYFRCRYPCTLTAGLPVLLPPLVLYFACHFPCTLTAIFSALYIAATTMIRSFRNSIDVYALEASTTGSQSAPWRGNCATSSMQS